MRRRFVVILGVIVAAIAIVAAVVSYAHPLAPTRIRSSPDACWFMASRHGKLALWEQAISPPPPDPKVFKVNLGDPFHMRVSTDASLFTSNFSPDWPKPDLGWNTIQDSHSTVFGPDGAAYNFTLRVRSLVLGWWVIAAVALVPLLIGSIIAFIRGRRVAKGLCPVCGFNMRASEMTDRCPKCGALAYNPIR
jgi:hypothetical protein